MLPEMRHEAPPTRDELQQPAAGVVIVAVRAQMLGQLVDALREHCDLDLGGAGVGLRAAVLLDDLELCFLGEGHWASYVDVSRAPAAPRQGCCDEPEQGRRVG